MTFCFVFCRLVGCRLVNLCVEENGTRVGVSNRPSYKHFGPECSQLFQQFKLFIDKEWTMTSRHLTAKIAYHHPSSTSIVNFRNIWGWLATSSSHWGWWYFISLPAGVSHVIWWHPSMRSWQTCLSLGELPKPSKTPQSFLWDFVWIHPH